jgi:UPF0271 protein
MQVDTAELASMVVYQLGALAGIARRAGCRVTHMSFHGAMGNMAAADAALATPLVRAVAEFDPGLIVLTSASPAIEGAAASAGLRAEICFLADRAYGEDGLLVPRRLEGAIISDADAMIARVTRLLADGTVVSHGGTALPMNATSILLHGDTAGAVTLARAIRGAVERCGARVTPLSRHKT